MKIARRFNAGNGINQEESPIGTAEMVDKRRINHIFSRPPGTHRLSPSLPGVETPGYYQMSLRDKLAFPHNDRHRGLSHNLPNSLTA